MGLKGESIKGKIRRLANVKGTDARMLLRLYMMERFLERLSVSRFKDQFVVKGGVLVTAMVGVSMRTTMDIDASIKNINMKPANILKVIQEICDTKIDDGITFELLKNETIMDNLEYPGVRVSLEASIEGIKVPIKIDISTGDIITPKEIRYEYRMLLEDKSIKLWTYNIETLLSEKIETILSRGVLNTRMRDFYDIFVLYEMYADRIDFSLLSSAITATSLQRGTTSIISQGEHTIEKLSQDSEIKYRWIQYQRKYEYAKDIKFDETLEVLKKIIEQKG